MKKYFPIDIQMIRPSFKPGIEKLKNKNFSMPKFERSGINRQIIRPAFKAPAIAARTVVDFEDAAGLDLSEATIDKLLTVKIPDMTDVKWLDERDRLVAIYNAQGMSDDEIKRELEVNKPLNREQRTVTEKRNIGDASVNIGDKLQALTEKINTGQAESKLQQGETIAKIGLVLEDTNKISELTEKQLTNLGESLARLGVPTDYRKLGLTRFVDNAYYLANAGLINLLLFSKVGAQPQTDEYNYDRLVKNFAGNPKTGLPAMKLTSAVTAMKRDVFPDRRYLDLEAGGIISLAQLRKEAENEKEGFDSPLFDIQPENR